MAFALRLPNVLPLRERGRAELTLVERPHRTGAKVFGIAAFVVGSMFVVTAMQTQMAERQMRIDRLNSDIIRARNNFDRLRAERARFQSPAYLTDRAAALGLVPSTETKMLPVPTDIAVEVASGMGKVDADVVASEASPLDQFGRMKRTVGDAP